MSVLKFGLFAMLAVACSTEEPSRVLDPAPLPPPNLSISVDATVEFVALEGGCWALRTAAGYYEPMSLPAGLRKHGQEVRVWISQAVDVASVCQIAPIVRVDSAITDTIED